MSRATIAVFDDLLYDCFIWSDLLPSVDETVTGCASDFFASGKGSNQASVCAKIGAEVFMLGKIGTDERGEFLLETMCGANVNVEGVIVDPVYPTSTDCVLVAKDAITPSSWLPMSR